MWWESFGFGKFNDGKIKLFTEIGSIFPSGEKKSSTKKATQKIQIMTKVVFWVCVL